MGTRINGDNLEVPGVATLNRILTGDIVAPGVGEGVTVAGEVGDAPDGDGGAIELIGGAGGDADGNGGRIELTAGNAAGAGTGGNIELNPGTGATPDESGKILLGTGNVRIYRNKLQIQNLDDGLFYDVVVRAGPVISVEGSGEA